MATPAAVKVLRRQFGPVPSVMLSGNSTGAEGGMEGGTDGVVGGVVTVIRS